MTSEADASPPTDVSYAVRDSNGRRERRSWSVFLFAALVTVVSMPYAIETNPDRGLDESWRIGLSLAHTQKLSFGEDLAFTFGPLGFLAHPRPVFPGGAVLGLLYAILTSFTLYAAFFHASRRWLPTWPAVALTAWFSFTAAMLPTPEMGAVALVLVAIPLVASREEMGLRSWVPFVLGFLCGIQLFVKLSVGLFFVAVAAIVVISRSGRLRNGASFAGSFLATIVGAWVMTGQPIAAIDVWFDRSMSILSGYTAAMARSPSEDKEMIGVAFMVLLIVASILTVSSWTDPPVSSNSPSRRTWVWLGMLLTGTVVFFAKAGLVRQDAGHLVNIQIPSAAILAAVCWPRGRRAVGAVAVCVVAIGPIVTLDDTLGATTRSVIELHLDGPRNATEIAVAFLSIDERQAQLAGTRDRVLDHHSINSVPRDLPSNLHAEPIDVEVVWALGAVWNPPPVFQSYSAYTSTLDRINAEHLMSPDAAEGILHADTAIDNQLPVWQTPATELAITCRYRRNGSVGRFQILLRDGDICLDPRHLVQVVADPGEAITVPKGRDPDSIVVLRLDYPVSLEDRLLTMLLKPLSQERVIVDGRTHKFIAATADNLHIVGVPSSDGRVDLPNGGLSMEELRFPDATRPLTATFFEVPLSDR